MTEHEKIIEYHDMTEAQKRIVDAGNVDLKDCIRVPDNLTRAELDAWLQQQFRANLQSEESITSPRMDAARAARDAAKAVAPLSWWQLACGRVRWLCWGLDRDK